MNKEVHPIRLKGNWEDGYALDFHTTKSEFIGHDDFGHPVFDTERSKIGQLLYALKYQSDRSVIPEIVRLVTSFTRFKTIDVIIPVPPSVKHRRFQPVLEIAKSIGATVDVPILTDVVKRKKDTPELKNIADVEERKRILQDAFAVGPIDALSGTNALLFDDLYRSGATLCTLTSLLYNEGKVKSIKVLTLTKTRSRS